MLKADAYGHGAKLCAPAVVRAGAEWLAVATQEEAVEVRRVAPNARVLVLGGVFEGQAEAAIELRLTPVVWESSQIELLEKAARAKAVEVPVHLEIDTGMSRQGVSVDGLAELISELQGSALRVEGVMTHLYAADEAEGEATGKQFEVSGERAGGDCEGGVEAGNFACGKFSGDFVRDGAGGCKACREIWHAGNVEAGAFAVWSAAGVCARVCERARGADERA